MRNDKYMVNGISPCMYRETRVTTSNQTQVPAELRAKHKLEAGDVVIWEEEDDGSLRVTFRKRRTLKDIEGLLDGADLPDAVTAKKNAQMGRYT